MGGGVWVWQCICVWCVCVVIHRYVIMYIHVCKFEIWYIKGPWPFPVLSTGLLHIPIAQGVLIIDEVKVYYFLWSVCTFFDKFDYMQVGVMLLWSSRSQKFIGHAMTQEELAYLCDVYTTLRPIVNSSPPVALARFDIWLRYNRTSLHIWWSIPASCTLPSSHRFYSPISHTWLWNSSSCLRWSYS